MTGYACLLLLLAVTTVTPTFWDCRNPSLSCNGGTCTSTGECDCTALTNLGSYDCNLDTTKKNAGDCADSKACKNGATCFDNTPGDGNVACYCTPEFFGEDCTENRFSVDCQSSSMTVTLKPEFNANGGIYVLGKTGCELTYDNAKKMYIKKIDHKGDSACGNINGVSDKGKTTYTRKLVVQENDNILTTSDFIVTYSCTFEPETVVTHSVTTVNVDENIGFGDAEIANTFGSVSVAASPADSTRAVGQIVDFTLLGDDDVDIVFIKQIQISAKGQTAFTIFDDGCPLDGTEAYFGLPHPGTSGSNMKKATAKMIVVKFKEADDLTWSFFVMKCLTSNQDPCRFSGCGQNKRRKRAAEPDVPDNTTEVVNYRIKVVETVQKLNEKRESECETSNKMTAAVVAMAVACFILLVICLVFIARAFSPRRYLSESKQTLS